MNATTRAPQQIIGTVTTYQGAEHRYLRGYTVRIIAVLKVTGESLKDDEAIAHAGGVTAADRVEVQPFLPAEDRFSFVTSDPRAVDLDCFNNLR